MTAEQQRAAIAAICNWTYDAATAEMVFVEDGQLCGVPWPSLDAIHLAERQLYPTGGKKWNRYIDRLCEVTVDAEETCVCATTDQRAEAFLKTLGRWVYS